MIGEFRANLNLVNKRLAEDSHKGTSFDPEKRAVQEIEGFGQYVNEVYDNLKKYANTEAQQEFLNSKMDRFQHGFAAKYNDHLAAEGRTISSFITGGSNFPVSRAEKANAAEHKRYEEMIEYRDKAQATILRELKKMAIQEAGGELEVMKKKLADAESNHEFMVKANAIVRKKLSDDEKVRQITALGTISEKIAREILKPDFMGRVGFPAYALSNDTANIARMKERIKEMEKKEATPSGDIHFEGGTIHDSKEDDRIQIFFDQKPPQEMIDKLKSEGWRWAPSVGAWSRKRTDMALFSARRILGLESQKPVLVPVKEQPKIDEEVHERIQKVIDIVKIYRDKGLTYEDFLIGLKGYYLQQSGYTMGSNLNAQKLIDDLKKSGYNNLRELWNKIIVQGPEREVIVSPKIPMLYPALQTPIIRAPTAHVTPAKYKLGQMVYSYQNPTTSAPIIDIHLSNDPLYPHNYVLRIPGSEGKGTKNSNYISENSLSDIPLVTPLRKENEDILAKINAERERIKATERAEENELNAELNKLPPQLKRYAETEISGTLHYPETHKDYHNRFIIALGKVRKIVSEHQPKIEKKEEPAEPLSDYDRVLKAYLENRGYELTLQDFIWADKYTLRGTARHIVASEAEKKRRQDYVSKNYNEDVGKKLHRGTVIAALERGIKVPDIVLKDYPDLVKKEVQLQPQKDKFAEIQAQMQRDRDKISGENLQKTAWQMTSKDFINESLKINKYLASYEKNPKLMNDFTNSLIQKWKELVEKHGEIGKLPDNVIDNYIQLFGEKALFSVFRGIKAKGIEGWVGIDRRIEYRLPISKLKEFATIIQNKYRLKNIYLGGSQSPISHHFPNKDSDIDFTSYRWDYQEYVEYVHANPDLTKIQCRTAHNCLVKEEINGNKIHLWVEPILFAPFKPIEEQILLIGQAPEPRKPQSSPAVKPISSPIVAPLPVSLNIFDQTTQRIRTARTLEELQNVRNEINTLPLFANERVKLLELYNTRYSLLLSEKPFGVPRQTPLTKAVVIGGITPQEQRKKAQQKLSTPPPRRLSEFGIGERAQRYYIPQRR